MTNRILLPLVFASGSLLAQVTYDRILHADREPQNWLTYSGGYASHRYSALLGKNFVKENWAIGIDESGRPIKNPALWPKPMGRVAYIEPGGQGGTNWYPPSYNPQTGLFYLSVWANYNEISSKGDPGPWVEGNATPARATVLLPAGGARSAGVARRRPFAVRAGPFRFIEWKRKGMGRSAPLTPRPAR
jgi:hypothetical protein